MDSLLKLSGIQENVPLANHTTFKIGGPARYFYIAKNNEEIIQAVQAAKGENIPFYILGGGSNLLVSDKGFNGLIIKFQAGTSSSQARASFKFQGNKIVVEAGVPLIKVIMETAKNSYSGLEWGFGIPGTIGGAVYGNVHRLGQAMAQVVESVEILDSNGAVKILKNDECGFVYGESRFKKTGEIILSATLVFKKQEQKIIDDVLEQAKKVVRQQPPFPSAGCVFKNYVLKSKNSLEDDLIKNFPELAERTKGGKIGVGYLIDQCGLKGKRIGGAKIWDGHANYIVNVGSPRPPRRDESRLGCSSGEASGAKAKDVVALINLCKEKVRRKFGVELEEEIRLVGF